MVGMTLVKSATNDLCEMMDVSLGISSATLRMRLVEMWEVLPPPRPMTAKSLFGSMMFTSACTLFWYISM